MSGKYMSWSEWQTDYLQRRRRREIILRAYVIQRLIDRNDNLPDWTKTQNLEESG